MIKYADIIGESLIDGTGIRVVVFFQGCPRKCDGCHNPDLQSADGGKEITEEAMVGLILKKLTPLHRGVTFSGGDPLMQVEALLKIILGIKEKKPHLDVWVYTGYTFEQVKDLPIIKEINILVDGPFILTKRDLTLPFRGSTNQRIIDVQSSLAKDQIVIFKLD